jgi:DNA-3-methyladenine glycosylase II
MTVLSISSVGPQDFELCLRIAGNFSSDQFQDFSVLRSPVRIQDKPTVLDLRRVRRDPPTLEGSTDLPNNASEVKRIARWSISADPDLRPFYGIAASHSVLGLITQELHGLKPMRPASLFEMLVIAITEQQISLTAAYRIRPRIIQRFGDDVNGLWSFPTPRRLSDSSAADLMTCGLSRRKSEYVKGLAAFYLLAHERLSR